MFHHSLVSLFSKITRIVVRFWTIGSKKWMPHIPPSLPTLYSSFPISSNSDELLMKLGFQGCQGGILTLSLKGGAGAAVPPARTAGGGSWVWVAAGVKLAIVSVAVGGGEGCRRPPEPLGTLR